MFSRGTGFADRDPVPHTTSNVISNQEKTEMDVYIQISGHKTIHRTKLEFARLKESRTTLKF